MQLRFLVGVMIFLGYFMIYLVRYNLSVHVVEMIELERLNNPIHIQRSIDKEIRKIFYSDSLRWNESKLAMLFSAYYVGFCICFPIFHNYCNRLGPKLVVSVTGVTSGILNCMTPASAFFSFWCLLLIRFVVGFCAGAMQPSLVRTLRQWVPPVERIHYMWTYCGLTLGTSCTLMLCAIVEYYSQWPLGFYSVGILQILWALTWIYAVTDKPREHPWITEEELIYLTNTNETIFPIKLAKFKTPWKHILKSTAFWALCIMNYGYVWMIMCLCLYGPIYYTMVGHYTLHTAAILTAVPFFLRLIFGSVLIHIYHWYKTNTDIKRIKHFKKLFIVVSHLVPGFLVLSCCFFKITPGPIILSIAVTLMAAGTDLTLDLAHELTPTYGNSLSTVLKIIGSTPGIIMPYCVGGVTYRFKDDIVWKYIWGFHGAVLVISGVIFLIWGDIKIQPWNSIRVTRPPKRVRGPPRVSVMSNIQEIDEEDSITQMSQIRESSRKSLFASITELIRINKK